MGMIMHDDVPYGEGTSYTQGTGIAINNNIIAVDADNTPTENSEKPVKSKGVYEEIEQIYADNGVLGAKNLLQIVNMSYSGIDTFVNSDGSITSRGTKASSGGSNFRILEPNKFMLPVGKYKLSLNGTPANKGLWLSLVPSTGDWITKATVTNGNEVEFEITSADLDKTISMFFVPVEAGTVIDWTYYPMIRLVSDPDDTYVPYAMTNRELTENAILKTVNDSLAYSGIASSNIMKLVHNGYVGMIQLDFTVDSTDIAAWTSLVQFNAPMYVNGGEDILAIFRDATENNMVLRRISINSSGVISFSNGFTNGHRYQTSFMVMMK